jgi:hypothetical protein
MEPGTNLAVIADRRLGYRAMNYADTWCLRVIVPRILGIEI